MKHSSLKFFFFLFLFSKAIFSQTNASLEKSGGFIILENKVEISAADKPKIESANFDEYRFYTIRKKIQLVRGPLIELLSIKELEQNGIAVSKTLVDIAKTKSESFKHESIGRVDLGLGVHSPHLPE